ncbi:DUF5336 domain-containing protein [Mycobacterium sp. NPDC003449]
MTYPPNNPGYPPAPQSGSQYDVTQQFAKSPAAVPGVPAAEGESNLAEILLATAAGAGVIAFLVSFGLDKQLVFASAVVSVLILLTLIAGLIAGVGLLPKQSGYTGIAAVLSLAAFLQVIYVVVAAEGDAGWALYTILALTLIQTFAAIGALLLETGVVTPPAPKPRYEQQPQYGQYGGPSQYYGQHNQPQPGGQPYQQQGPGQRPGYPSQYGGYPGGSNTGGFGTVGQQGAPQGGQQSGPPTPPTGFPTYGQPQQQQTPSTATTTQVPTPPQAQPPSSPQSGSSSS